MGVNFLNKNCFEAVCDLISANDKMKKFDISKKSKNEISISRDSVNYSVKYDEDRKVIVLENVDSENSSELASWLLDDLKFTQKDVALISKDFIETMAGKDKKNIKQSKKKNKSSDESNITGLFFANRMVNIFPELKEEIQNEKAEYAEFRSANFAVEHILPKVQKLSENLSDKSKLSKFGKLLSDLYKNGTLDTRSIITMGILNSIKGENAVKNLKSVFSEEMNKAWDAALKYKNKKVAPEKQKTKKSFLSRALEAQQQNQ